MEKKSLIIIFLIVIILYNINHVESLTNKDLCYSDDECNDKDYCTIDSCILTGYGNYCLNSFINGCCLAKWKCTEWSNCTNSRQIRDCKNLNSCKDLSKKPAEIKFCFLDLVMIEPINNFENIEELDPIIYDCEPWSDCLTKYDLNTIISGNLFLEGISSRICLNKNSKTKFYQNKKCNVKSKIRIVEIKKCLKTFIEVYNENNELISLIDLDKNGDYEQLNIDFPYYNQTYCDYCYDGVKDYDEDSVDCINNETGSCPKCNFHKINIIPSRRYFNVLFWLFYLLLILALVIVTYFIKKQKNKRKK